MMLMCGAGTILGVSLTANASEAARPEMVGNNAITTAVDTIATDTVPDYKDLGEFVVVRKKPVVQANGEKGTYNVAEDPASKSTTVLEMLRKVPMVTVDGQDNILVNGQSNFKIYVNGKEDPMLSANAKQVLKVMPASQIVKIEVLREPGAKYDAEGTAGILNFVINRTQQQDGYSGALSLGVSRNNIEASGFAKARYGKMTGSVSLAYADQNLWDQKNHGNGTTLYLGNSTDHLLKSSQNQRNNWSYWNTGLDLSWEPDSLNLFTVNFSFMNVDARIKSMNMRSTMYDAEGALRYDYMQRIGGKMVNRAITAGASWQHLFGAQNHNLIVSYLYNYGLNRLDWNKRTEGIAEIQFPYTLSDEMTENNNNEHTVQVDYTNPFGGEKHTLETGAKGVFRRNSANSWQKIGNSFSDLVGNTDNDIRMNQYQDVVGAYASYGGNFGKTGVKAGVRWEYTHMGIDFKRGTQKDFSTVLNDVIPNVALSYSFSPAHSLRLSYQMRISRPTIQQVNPYELKIDDTAVQTGNPDLSSEKSNKVTFTYTNFGRVVGGYVSLEYGRINNVISPFIYSEGNVIYTTYANLGKQNMTSVNGFFNWNLSQKMTFNLNGTLSYVDLRSPNPYRQGDADAQAKLKKGGWTGSFGANWNYTMPGNVKWSAWGGKSWGEVSLQYERSGWYYYGIGVSRSFLKKDALTLSVYASGFFENERHFKSVTRTPGVLTVSNWFTRSWSVGCSLTWNFGSLKTDVKKVSKRIVNDDKNSASGKSQGGGLM